MKVVYQVTRGCTICMNCVHQCPVKAIKLSDKGMRVDEDKCIGCGLCYKQCASEAITRKEIIHESK